MLDSVIKNKLENTFSVWPCNRKKSGK
jgi:hypothetical protein